MPLGTRPNWQWQKPDLVLDASPRSFRIFKPRDPEQEVRCRAARDLRELLLELSGLDDKTIDELMEGAAGPAAGYLDPVVGPPGVRARAPETYQRLKDG